MVRTKLIKKAMLATVIATASLAMGCTAEDVASVTESVNEQVETVKETTESINKKTTELSEKLDSINAESTEEVKELTEEEKKQAELQARIDAIDENTEREEYLSILADSNSETETVEELFGDKTSQTVKSLYLRNEDNDYFALFISLGTNSHDFPKLTVADANVKIAEAEEKTASAKADDEAYAEAHPDDDGSYDINDLVADIVAEEEAKRKAEIEREVEEAKKNMVVPHTGLTTSSDDIYHEGRELTEEEIEQIHREGGGLNLSFD